MGKTLKKKTKKKARRRANPKSPMQESQKKDLLQAEGTLRHVVESFEPHLATQAEAGEFSQDDMAAALLFERLKTLSGEGRKLFDIAVLDAYDGGKGTLTFEPGRIVCNVNSTSRRAPQWKEEAVKLALLLQDVFDAAEDGDQDKVVELTQKFDRFDRKRWEESVSEGYDPKTTYKPKLTEGL